MKEKTATVKVISCIQNGHEFYSAVIPSNMLKEICFISRRENDSKEGFQRKLNESRAKNIASYLNQEKNAFHRH